MKHATYIHSSPVSERKKATHCFLAPSHVGCLLAFYSKLPFSLESWTLFKKTHESLKLNFGLLENSSFSSPTYTHRAWSCCCWLQWVRTHSYEQGLQNYTIVCYHRVAPHYWVATLFGEHLFYWVPLVFFHSTEYTQTIFKKCKAFSSENTHTHTQIIVTILQANIKKGNHFGPSKLVSFSLLSKIYSTFRSLVLLIFIVFSIGNKKPWYTLGGRVEGGA